jgi:CheY-like chemotaxis protein
MEKANVSGRIILFGEDDKDDEEFLSEAFTAVDNTLTLCFVNSGQKLIPALEEMDHLPCLIVLDYNMPGLNAAEILQQLNNYPRYKNVPKVIWSTSGSDTYRKLCLDSGATEYIIKPSNISGLEEAARLMLSYCTNEK